MLGDSVGVASFDEETGLAVLDLEGNAPGACGDHGFALLWGVLVSFFLPKRRCKGGRWECYYLVECFGDLDFEAFTQG